MELLKTNPGWTIRTDDWGFFYRARVERSSNSFWEDYDVLIQIGITGFLTGTMWVITSIINIVKFCYGRWDLSCKVQSIVNINRDLH